jgi:AraC family transcriptional regulator of adaptative response / DNA-3-methyladenine glycosylase II
LPPAPRPDADPEAVDEALGADPVLAPLVSGTPGRRSPGAADGTELLVRAVIGQQVSVAGARTVAGRVAATLGEELPASLLAVPGAPSGLVRAFPDAAALAGADPGGFSMPRARGQALIDACGLVADGSVALDPGSDRVEVERRLLQVKGIGPWTTAYIAMRALSDPDVFLPTDLGVLRGLAALGGPDEPKAAALLAERWRPWRSYALHHLWPAGG